MHTVAMHAGPMLELARRFKALNLVALHV